METFSGNDSKDKEPQKSDSNAREFTNIFLPSHHTMNQNLPKDPRNPNNSIPMQAYNYPSGDSWRDLYNSTNNGQNSRSQPILAGNNPNNFFYNAHKPQFHSQESQGVPTMNRQAAGQGKPQDEKYNQFISSADQQNNFPGIDTLKQQQMLQLRQSQQMQAQYNPSQIPTGYPMHQAQQNFQASQMNQPQRIQPRPQMNPQQNPPMNPKYQTQNFAQPHQIPNLDPSYLQQQQQQQQKTSASQPSQINQVASMQQSLRQQNQMMHHYQGNNLQAQAQLQAAYQQSLLAQQQQGQAQGQNARNNSVPQKMNPNMQNRSFPQGTNSNNNNADQMHQMNKMNPYNQMQNPQQFSQMNPIPAFPQPNQKQMMQQMKYPQNPQNQAQQQYSQQNNQKFPNSENTQVNFPQNFQQSNQNPLPKHQQQLQYHQYQYQQMLQNSDLQKQQQYQNPNQNQQYKQPENVSQTAPQMFQYPQGNPYAQMASKMHPNLIQQQQQQQLQPQLLRNMMPEKEQKVIPSPSPNPEQFLNNNTQKQPLSQPPSQPQSQPHTPNTAQTQIQTQYKSQTRIQQQQTQEIAPNNKNHKQMNTVQFVREIYKMTQIQQIPQSPQANNTPTTQQQSQAPSASQQNLLNPTLKHPLNMSYEQFEMMRQKMTENLKQNIERMNQEYREKKQKEETTSQQTTEAAETPTTKKSTLPQPQTLTKTHSTPKKQKSQTKESESSKKETEGPEKTDTMEEEKDDKDDESKIPKPKQKRRPRNRDKSKETGKKSHKRSQSKDEILEEALKEGDKDDHQKQEMNIETTEKPAEGGPPLNLKKETSLILTRETSSSKGKMIKKNQQLKRSHSKKIDTTTESHAKEEQSIHHHTQQQEQAHDAKKSEMKAIEPKSYQELIQTMQYMSRFEWLQENSVSHKILPYKLITPAVVWFMICANYFPIEALRSPDAKKFVQETFDQLREIHLESVQRISSTLSLDSKPEDSFEAELLSSLSQAIQASTKNINLQEFQEETTTESRILKQTDCEEDDEWIAETKRFISDSTKRLGEEGLLPPAEQPIPQNFNVISKLNLDDLISLYEVDLHNQALENKQQQQSLEKLFSQGLNDGNMLRLIEFNREDAICDISIAYPEDEKFVSMIERKQNDNSRPAHKAGEKRIPTQEGGKTLQNNRREILQPEDSFCQICNDGESYEDNQIVFCARCNISVHQKCYGIPVVPKEDWICDLCINFDINGKYLRCPLCDKRGGAMKPTSTKADSDTFAEKNPEYHQFLKSYPKNFNYKSLVNRRPLTFRDIKRTRRDSKSITKSENEEDESDYQEKLYYDYHSINESDFTSEELKNEPQPPSIWIHIACAMFIPELHFSDKIEKTHIQGLEEVDKNRFVHECDICKKKQGGATINCERGLCSKWFHPECARRAKQYLEIRKVDATEVVYNIYCEKHTPLQLKRTLESKDKKNREDITRFFKALDRYYLTFLNEPRLFGLEGSAVIPQNEEVAKILAATTAAPKKKKPQESAPPTSRREDGSYYFKLVEKFRKKSCKIPCYITLQKTHDMENVETYKILEVTNPKPPLAPDRRLGEKDPIWEMMQYKGLTSLQKYRKYKKIEYKMKKKAREKEEKEKVQVQVEQPKKDQKPTRRASESKPIPEPQEAHPLSEISEEEFGSKGLQITIQDTQVFSDVESSRMTHTDSPFSRKRPSPPLSDKVDSGRKLSFDGSFQKQGSPPKFSTAAAEPTTMNIESAEQTEKGESAITEAESPKIKKKKRATVVNKADSPGPQNTNLLSLKPNQVEPTGFQPLSSFSGGSMVEETKDSHQVQNDHSVSNLLSSFMLNGEEEQKGENEQIICICKRPYRGEPVISCEDCGSMCHPECISQRGDFNPSISSFKCSNCYTQLNCEESLSDMQQVLLDKRHGYHNDFEEEPDILKKINFGMNVRNFY